MITDARPTSVVKCLFFSHQLFTPLIEDARGAQRIIAESKSLTTAGEFFLNIRVIPKQISHAIQQLMCVKRFQLRVRSLSIKADMFSSA